MSTDRDMLIKALDRAKDLEETVKRMRNAHEEARERVEDLEQQLRQAHRATEPRNPSKPMDECSQASTPRPRQRVSWFSPEGPQPGDASSCPCGCGYAVGVP